MIEVRATAESDVEGLSALFTRRFGHPFTAAEWRWKYGQVPGLAHSVVALDAAGTVVAHAGALRLPARWRGGMGGIWQLVDFAGVAAGGGLRPALVEAGRALLAGLPAAAPAAPGLPATPAPPPITAPWIFGFPSERHFRLGERVFGYRPLTRIAPLAGELPAVPAAGGATGAGAGGPPAAAGSALFTAGDSCGEWAAAAWKECGVLGVVRSVEFLNWRYWARPGRYYRVYRLHEAGDAGGSGAGASRAEGLAVFAFVGDEAWATELWLPPRGEWYAPMLAVAADLRDAGLRLWRFWPPAAEAAAALLRRLGLRPGGDTRFVGCRAAAGDADPAAAVDPVVAAAGFHYSMGDFDLA